MEDPPPDPGRELSPSIENPTLPNGLPLLPDDAALSGLQSLRESLNSDLQFKSFNVEETREEDLLDAEAASKDQKEVDLEERLDLASETLVFRTRVSDLLEERGSRGKALSEILDSIRSVKGCLMRIVERIGAENLQQKAEVEDGLEALLLESRSMHKLGMEAESKFLEYDEMRRKEKELENSIVSLTEENRDMGNLLRIALMEKDAVEKSLSRLKGSGEQKRVAILQIAERGLQKVGFGFMMGSVAGESQSDQPSSSTASMKSDGSECEEEVASLASTVEKIMKNLRLEITDLRRSLEESRSDSEHLQSLVDKQAQKIAESTEYIKHLEEKENILVQNVEELMYEIAEAGEEVARWREACQLEVEAGKTAIEERVREVAMLRGELERTKAALNAANNKVVLKERLAATAMAAQAAAEATLRLADSRSLGFRERIEELTRQLEEETDCSRKEHSSSRRRKVRHVCWPWQALKLMPTPHSAAASQSGSRSKRMLPEMESMLHFRI